MSIPLHVIFWRHAEAEEAPAVGSVAAGSPADLGRTLTRQGRRDASRVAVWIKAHLPKPWTVCTSPALRARETATALADYPLQDARLAPERGVDDLLAVLESHRGNGGTIVLCGHQPTVGSAALRWLTGCEQAFSLRKGALLWIAERDRDGELSRSLRAAIAPDLID